MVEAGNDAVSHLSSVYPISTKVLCTLRHASSSTIEPLSDCGQLEWHADGGSGGGGGFGGEGGGNGGGDDGGEGGEGG